MVVGRKLEFCHNDSHVVTIITTVLTATLLCV